MGTSGAPVLLIEDDEILWPLLAALLQSDGFDVERVADGEEALKWLAELDASLLIIDANIACPSASEFLRRLRRASLATDAPVLSLIMPGQSCLRGTLNGLGVNEFITEPFEPAEIVAAAGRLTTEALVS